MQQKVLIIGNSDVAKDYSEFVDACDIVIRFNLCRNYAINTGRKLDILCLANTGGAGKALYKRKKLSQSDWIRDVKKIWFVGARRSLWSNLYFGFFNKSQIDYAKKIIKANRLGDKKTEYFTEELNQVLWSKLLQLGNTHAVIPSSGMLVIEKTLSDERYADYEKYVLGFSHQGWHGHPWELEQRLLEKYLSLGLLEKLDDC